ncbi:CoA binding domain-containing protein [Mycena belliarum]|uniref:CoA binding domain-containing protein n=1 Tax=Mycena belliarum TaxID=1033014 RepID=A0AAD6UGN7_9AGAR|nr:CoA binding domain-containing protein [Mycena belliae]
MTSKLAIVNQKKERFLSAPYFAVVGASTNPAKNGYKALKWLVEQHKDVTPVNLKASEIQGLKCVKALSELPDPTHTSVSIVVHPEATLDIMQQAKNLGIFALWLQPGAEDDAVVQFIQADAQLDQRCIYSTHALHDSPLLVHALATGPGTDTNGQCLFAEPTAVATAPPPAAPAVASNVAAGIKRDMLSPPSTPPVTKSAKLADDSVHTMDLGEEIPGLA